MHFIQTELNLVTCINSARERLLKSLTNEINIMCGIVGIINKNGRSVELEVLSRMADKLTHRGPDDEGHLIDGTIGVYHKRLSIIDLISGRQPMTNGPVSIVFNGEIYNYIELKYSLKRKVDERQPYRRQRRIRCVFRHVRHDS